MNNNYLQTALSGWSGVVLFGSGLAMPYLLRRTRGAPRGTRPQPLVSPAGLPLFSQHRLETEDVQSLLGY
jgi:hypothetical protein